MKTFVVSDIHGRFDELMRALEYSKYSDSDRLIVLGDNIDRGDDSRKVMEFLLALRNNNDNRFLKGNHEGWILDMSAGHARMAYLWLMQGEGLATLKSYGLLHHRIYFLGKKVAYVERDFNMKITREIPLKDKKIKEFIKVVFPSEHLAFMASMQDYYEEGDYFFSHAGVQAGIPLSRQKPLSLVFGDEVFVNGDTTDYGKVLVYGHWHSSDRGFNVTDKRICIAIAGDKIGILNLTEMTYIDSDGKPLQIDVKKYSILKCAQEDSNPRPSDS